MSRSFKTVAIVLALILLAGSLPALACARQGTTMSSHCGPHCPMMKARLAGTAVQATPQGTSCCDISSGKPVPASVPMAPTSSAPLVITPQMTHMLAQMVVVPTTGPRDSVPIALPSPPQALLCIFLI